MPRAWSLRQKEVIDITGAKRLGVVHDVEFSLETGVIEAIVVPKPPRLLHTLFPGREYVIPWKDIVCVGNDLVLVRYDEKTMKKQAQNLEIKGNI